MSASRPRRGEKCPGLRSPASLRGVGAREGRAPRASAREGYDEQMTFTDAAAEVLRLVGRPLHYKEITDIAIEKNLLSHVGKSPEVTMGARLAAIPGLKSYNPPGAFYFYPDLSAFIGKTTPKGEVIRDIDHLTEYLLMEGGVAVIPGTAFGTDRHVRISYAYAMEYLEKGCDRMAQALTALK